MSKHTKGPWHRNIPPATKYPTLFAGRNTHVAYLNTQLPADEVEANCRLIAAAPTLFEAVEAALNVEGIELPPSLVKQLSDAANLADPK